MFWPENCKVIPQRLLDIAALNFTSSGLEHRHQIIPQYIKHILAKYVCGLYVKLSKKQKQTQLFSDRVVSVINLHEIFLS